MSLSSPDPFKAALTFFGLMFVGLLLNAVLLMVALMILEVVGLLDLASLLEARTRPVVRLAGADL